MTRIERSYRDGLFGQVHLRIARAAVDTGRPPVFCLHQTPSNGREWEPLMRELSRTRTVIAPDTPGYGMSEPPPEPASIPDFARNVGMIADQLAAEGVIAAGAFDVIGYHTGSIIAAELGRSDPRARRIVMFSLAAYEADVREEKIANLPQSFPPLDETLAREERIWWFSANFGDKRISMEDRHVGLAECIRTGHRMTWGYDAVYRYDFLGALASLDRPVLVANPEDDLEDVTRRTAPIIPNGTLWELPGRAHGFMAFEAADVAERIGAFLDAE